MIEDVVTGSREVEWRAFLLDENDRVVRELYEFQDGSLEQNMFRSIRGGGSMLLQTNPGEKDFDIDWGKARFRFEHYVNGVSKSCGIYLPEKPTTVYDEEDRTAQASVSLMDKTLILEQDGPRNTFSLDEGVVVTEAIARIFEEMGEERLIIEDAPNLTLPVARQYSVENNWLQIVNDLCSIINYWACYADEEGYFRIDKYRDPAGRTPVFTFEYGEDSIYKPIWQEEQDWFSVPNLVVLESDGDEEEEGFEAYAENRDPTSPFSVQNRGRTIRLVEQGVEAADEAVLNELAQRRLRDVTGAVTNAFLDHAPIPLWPNDRVNFVSVSKGEVQSYTVTKWDVNMRAGSLMATRFRKLVSV